MGLLDEAMTTRRKSPAGPTGTAIRPETPRPAPVDNPDPGRADPATDGGYTRDSEAATTPFSPGRLETATVDVDRITGGPLSRAATATAGQAEATTAAASKASATGYDAQNVRRDQLAGADQATAARATAAQGRVAPSMTTEGRLTALLSRDSAYMRRAAHGGLLSAARRGLGTSSFAAGAAHGAAIDRAAPIAEADAARAYDNMRANTNAQNQMEALNAQLETAVSQGNAQLETQTRQQINALQTQMATTDAQMQNRAAEVSTERQTRASELNAQIEAQTNQYNAEAQNRIAQLNAQLETAVSQGNAEMQTRLNQQIMGIQADTARFNAEAQNRMSLSQFQADHEMARQYLQGEQAREIATMQQRYNLLISSNEQAGRIYQSYFNAMAGAAQNPEFSISDIRGVHNALWPQVTGGIEFVAALEGFDPEGDAAPPAPETPETPAGPTDGRPSWWPDGQPWPPNLAAAA